MVLGFDGVADFNALHSRRHDHDVRLYAFDIMALDGEEAARSAFAGRGWRTIVGGCVAAQV